MKYAAFPEQARFHQSPARIRGAFAGKRGGKTEAGAVECIRFAHSQPGYNPGGVDPYIGVIIAPTTDMLRRLSLAKFEAYGKHGIAKHHKTFNEYEWQNGTVIYGISADKPQRIEGIKAGFIWVDEVFQVSEQLFLEALARVSDTKGHVWVTGSLGVQYANPKQHWAHKYFKEKPLEDSACFEWATAQNPYFPRDELERLKDTLDPTSYRQMFEICWDIMPDDRVYNDFTEDNILKGYSYDPKKPCFVSIDWGWAHPMAVGFFQVDGNRVILFDEIISSRLTLDDLWDKIQGKGYRITQYFCDIAGNQEREQTGYSNVEWFRKKGVHFKYRSSAVTYGISIVRSFVKNSKGVRRFYITSACPRSIDGMLNYSYQSKEGIILNENPVKKDDDAVDMIRYFFVNQFDPRNQGRTFHDYNRWSR